MKIVEKEIVIEQQTFILTNQRAIFWPQQKSLILSDLHLGKAAHFRKSGIAISAAVGIDDLNRLKQLILHFQPTQLIIVGDFLHAGMNKEVLQFKAWQLQFPNINILLIKGNHDRIQENKLQELGIQHILPIWKLETIAFSHQDITLDNSFVISGHLHPGVKVKLDIKKHTSFPCYILTPNKLILPAFSSFTGLDTDCHPENAQYYIFSEEGIFEI